MDVIEEILRVLENHNKFVISTHISPDGDALGAQLGLLSFLNDLGKQVWAVNTDPVPAVYKFLPFSDVISSSPPALFDILIVVDAGSLVRIGDDLSKVLLPEKAIINIDHHVTNDRFGNYNWIDADACAVSELIYQLIKRHGMSIGQKRASCLYTGIMTDTGGFRFSNTTPVAHRIAAELIAEGISVDEIYRFVYESLPSSRIKLLGLVLSTLQVSLDGKIAWICVTQNMYERTGTTQEDTENFIDYVKSIATVEVALFFVELKSGKTKVSFRSKNEFDVSKVAANWGGGGHQRAAGCTIKASIDETEKIVIADVQRELETERAN
ncbi:bifunctional oligoribonuclease/PAP phosphatase NrnA [Candidatus Poribacteria bacterium]|nr:bifunctional oligoribonuclease/PAP phosphatase NrnA [Candidatus Poribacteria bacterium]